MSVTVSVALNSLRALPRRLEPLAHAAGLVATAWLVLPHRGPLLIQRFFGGLATATLALTWALVVVLMLRLVVSHISRAAFIPATFRTASAGVWFAPAILLPLTPWGVTASVVLVIGATRLLCTGPQASDSSPPAAGAVLGTGELSYDALSRHLAPALAASVGLQGAVVMALLGHLATAEALFSFSVAILTSVAIALGAWTESRAPNLPRSVMGLCLTFLLAMMAGRFLGNGRGSGEGAGSDSAFGRGQSAPATQLVSAPPKKPDAPPTPPPGATGEVMPDPRFSEVSVPGSFPGVILWPEVKPEVMLVDPEPVTRTFGAPTIARPFVIPFGGEYWMFRWPFSRPPRTSYFQRGSPVRLKFATTDGSSLQMQALQKLDRPISMRCCSKIQVEVQDADRAGAGIVLELIVTDTEPPYKPPLSLGTAHLRGSTVETLDFLVPAAPPLAQFDELKVVYRRDFRHRDESSRVAIDRFLLVP